VTDAPVVTEQQPTDDADTGSAPSPRTRVRRRLARVAAAARPAPSPPELSPLFRTLRQTHPKADIRVVQRAYEVAEVHHRGQARRSGDPYITHPLAVAQILAEIGMTETEIAAALLHDTV
jgi:GTP pyrophosphokinase